MEVVDEGSAGTRDSLRCFESCPSYGPPKTTVAVTSRDRQDIQRVDGGICVSRTLDHDGGGSRVKTQEEWRVRSLSVTWTTSVVVHSSSTEDEDPSTWATGPT